MNFSAIKNKYFKSTEEVVSMFLGLVIVVVVGGLIFNYFQKNKGTIDIPGSNSEIVLTNKDEKLTSNGEKIYKVKKGDSLWKIALAEYNDGYSWTKIATANNLKNPSDSMCVMRFSIPFLLVSINLLIIKSFDFLII